MERKRSGLERLALAGSAAGLIAGMGLGAYFLDKADKTRFSEGKLQDFYESQRIVSIGKISEPEFGQAFDEMPVKSYDFAVKEYAVLKNDSEVLKKIGAIAHNSNYALLANAIAMISAIPLAGFFLGRKRSLFE